MASDEPTTATITELQAENARLRLLLDAFRKTTRELDIDAALNAVMDAAQEVFGADRCLLVLATPGSTRRTVRTARGLSADYLRHVETGHIPLQAILEQQPTVVVPDVLAAPDELYSPELRRLIAAEGFRAVTAVRLEHLGSILGALAFFFDVPRELSAAEIELARLFADQAAVALVHAQDFELVRQISLQREQSEQRLQAILDRIRDHVIVWSPQMEIQLANATARAFLATHGAPDDLECFSRLMPPPDNCPIHLAFRHGQPILGCEVFFGENVFAVDCHPLRDPVTGDLLAVVQHARDVTENHRLQRELAVSEQRIRLALENSPVGIAFLDVPDGRVVMANRALADLLGLEPERLEARQLIELVAPEHRAQALESWDEVQWLGCAAIERVDLRLADGSTIPVSLMLGRIDYGDGTRQVQCVVKDIRRRLKLQSQLVEQEKLAAIGQLASGVAHELRNPIGIIASALFDLEEILEVDNDEVVEDLTIAREEITRVQEIITTVLDFARVGQTEREWVDVTELFRQTAKLLAKSLATRDVTLTVVGEETPEVWANRGALRQVALNLITNAFQASADGGRIDVHVWSPETDQVAFAVADTGQGIPPEALSQIFNPFFTTKAPGQGTGLGLSIVHATVREHGGEIEVSSEPGRGTTFTVVLPRRAQDRPEPRRNPLAAAADELL